MAQSSQRKEPPQIPGRFTAQEDKPRVLFSGMFERDKGSDVQKGAYAQTLAQAIAAKGAVFKAPPYIQAMLEFIAKD